MELLELLLINAHPRRRQVEPDDFGGQQTKIFPAATAVFHDLVAVLHPAAARFENGADFLREFIGFFLGKIQ